MKKSATGGKPPKKSKKSSAEELVKQLIASQGKGDALYIGGIPQNRPKEKVIESVKTEVVNWLRRQIELEKLYSVEDLETTAEAAFEEIKDEL